MHSLAPAPIGSFALALPFPAASGDGASPEKAPLKGAGIPTGESFAAGQFPELLSGLTGSACQPDTEPHNKTAPASIKEDGPQAPFWLSSAPSFGQSLAQFRVPPAAAATNSSAPVTDAAATLDATAAESAALASPAEIPPATPFCLPSAPAHGSPLERVSAPSKPASAISSTPIALAPIEPAAARAPAPQAAAESVMPAVVTVDTASATATSGLKLDAPTPAAAQATAGSRNANAAETFVVPAAVTIYTAAPVTGPSALKLNAPTPAAAQATTGSRNPGATLQQRESWRQSLVPVNTTPTVAPQPAFSQRPARAAAPERNTAAPDDKSLPLVQLPEQLCEPDLRGAPEQPRTEAVPESPQPTPRSVSEPPVMAAQARVQAEAWNLRPMKSPAAGPNGFTVGSQSRTAADRPQRAASVPSRDDASQLTAEIIPDAFQPAAIATVAIATVAIATVAPPAGPTIESQPSPTWVTSKAGTGSSKNPQNPWVRKQASAGARDAQASADVCSAIVSSIAPPLAQPVVSISPAGETVAPPPAAAPSRQSIAPTGDQARPQPQHTVASVPAGEPSADAASTAPPQQPSKLAFALTLQPVDSAPKEQSVVPVLKPAEPLLPEAPPPVPDASARTAETSLRPVAAPAGKQSDAIQEAWRKTAGGATPALGATPAGHMQPGPLVAPAGQPVASSNATEHAAPAETPARTAPSHIDSAAAPVQAAAAHDIKLQVGGEGEQQVEVRVTERRGDVYVAVRTPDGRLAGDLRQNLPTLADRLEQSGFHATTWQPAAATEHQRLADPQAAASGQDSQNQSRQNGREQQRDPQEQKQKGPDGPAQRKEPGKDFEWLLSSIR